MGCNVWQACVCVCARACLEGGYWEGRGSNKRFSSSGCIVVEITNVSI